MINARVIGKLLMNASQTEEPQSDRVATTNNELEAKTPANVRQLLGRPGEVWGAESGVDKLVVVRTG